MSNVSKGKYYEDLALEYLCNMGFEYIGRNFYIRYGEIDLILKKDNILHFIEVKYSSVMNPLLKINHKKLDRIIKSIEIFMQQNNLSNHFCIDAVSIYKNQISFIENVTIQQ